MSENETRRSEKKQKRFKGTMNIINPLKKTIFSAVFGSIASFFKMSIKVFARQIKREITRLMSGLLSIFVGVIFLIFVWLILNITITIGLNKFFNMDYFYGSLIIAGLNLFIGLIFILSGKRQLSEEMFKEMKDFLDEE